VSHPTRLPLFLSIPDLQQICLHHPACYCSSAKQKRQRSLTRPVSHPTLLPLSPRNLSLATNLPASPSLLLQQCQAKTPTQPSSSGVTPHTAPPFSSRSRTCNKSACITQPAAAAVPSKNANAALLARCHTPHCSPFLLAISHLQQICLHHPACCCSSAPQKRQATYALFSTWIYRESSIVAPSKSPDANSLPPQSLIRNTHACMHDTQHNVQLFGR